MPESRIARADRRSRWMLDRAGSELRTARQAAGLTLEEVGRAARLSPSELSRIERGVAPWAEVGVLTRVAMIVGLDMSVRVYPGGEPLRDLGHLRLTVAFKAILGPDLAVQAEVPIGDIRDQRAWDLTITDVDRRVCGTELETRLVDAQSQMRKIIRKRTDSKVDRLLVVLADTRSNRIALRAAAAVLATNLSIDDAAAYSALRRGELPPRDALIFVRPLKALGRSTSCCPTAADDAI